MTTGWGEAGHRIEDAFVFVFLVIALAGLLAVALHVLMPDLPPCPPGEERVGLDSVCRTSPAATFP